MEVSAAGVGGRQRGAEQYGAEALHAVVAEHVLQRPHELQRRLVLRPARALHAAADCHLRYILIVVSI